MARNVILHDQRVAGTMPLNDSLKTVVNNKVITVNAATTLMTAFVSINAMAKEQGKIGTLFVICHGYSSNRSMGDFYWHPGGLGLELGLEDLLHQNVHLWSLISNSVKNIVIMACGAAATQPGGKGDPAKDGKVLLQTLAKTTYAVVYAADQTQWYTPNGFNFGSWEGTLYCFLPTGDFFPVPPGEVANALAEFKF